MLEECDITCPYCGEHFVTLVDTALDNQQYIEDCQICCNPIVFELRIDTMSGEPNLNVRRDND
jgi:hypothetical protein